MKKETRTIKIWIETHRRIRILAALSGETIGAYVNRLVEEDWRVKKMAVNQLSNDLDGEEVQRTPTR